MASTIVLVHGAFAESASWDRVIRPLRDAGHDVIAAANPVRGLAADAAAVSDLVRSVEGPVVLVAHSYGGAVISNVGSDAGEIAGLVFVNGFAPEVALMAATQRPAAQEALVEPAGARPLWRDVPSWFLIGEEDRIIPAELRRHMARRARSERTVAVAGASHAIAVSRPDATANLILKAAAPLRAAA